MWLVWLDRSDRLFRLGRCVSGRRVLGNFVPIRVLTRLLGGLRIGRGRCGERKLKRRDRYGSLLLSLSVGLRLGLGRRLGRF